MTRYVPFGRGGQLVSEWAQQEHADTIRQAFLEHRISRADLYLELDGGRITEEQHDAMVRAAEGRVLFEVRTITVIKANRNHERFPKDINAVVALGTHFAYHPVIAGTRIAQAFPHAYEVSNTRNGGLITTFPLPADAETAEALVKHLVISGVACDSKSQEMHATIEAFAQTTGHWHRYPGNEVQDA